VKGRVSHLRYGSCAAAALMVGAWALLAVVPAGAGQPPALKVTAAPFHDGERINVSVGPNHYFTPYSHVNILECADPGGKKAHLPTSVASCDGNTIQGNTVLVNKNGSFSENEFEIYALPNKMQLGELSDNRPVCNEKARCVLYVGQDQERFTAPKLFSSPFSVRSAKAHS
jgi:hypothetical protein